MDHVGLDLGKRESQIAILAEDGELINMRIRTERRRLVEMFGRRPKARILMEASTESEWVARCLEDLGHEGIVAVRSPRVTRAPRLPRGFCSHPRRLDHSHPVARAAGGVSLPHWSARDLSHAGGGTGAPACAHDGARAAGRTPRSHQ